LEHEVGGKARPIAQHRLVEVAGGDAIHRGQIAVEHHALAANQQDGLLDLWWRNQFRFVAHDEKTIRTFDFSGKGAF
jgi:hypothetical protein